MSRYHTQQQHLQQLGELLGIISSMKTLSQLELQKLGNLVPSQQALAESLKGTASEFLRHFPDCSPQAPEGPVVWLVIGSERGFCADFNEALLERLQQLRQEQAMDSVIAVGRKLWTRMEDAGIDCVPLEGANVIEELTPALTRVSSATQRELERLPGARLRVLSHEEVGLASQQLLPPEAGEPVTRGYPPQLYLSPQHFYRELLPHYLFLLLHELFCVSLQAENHRRVQHLESAVQRLEGRLESMRRRANALRQEEITNEIEMILLGMESLGTRPGEPSKPKSG